MTSEEFKATRQALGYTQVEMAKAISKSLRMIVHYESGQFKIPGHVDLLLKLLSQQSNNNPKNEYH